MGILFILLGTGMIAWSVSAWLGWDRLWARGPLGNIVVPLGPMGLGVVLMGVDGLTGARWLLGPALIVGCAGVVLYTASPEWLEPPWYRDVKRKAPRPRNGGSATSGQGDRGDTSIH